VLGALAAETGTPEPVNRFETPGAANYRGSSCVSLVGFGGWIQAAVGSGGGRGGWRTKRSGWAA
jgi:hypothetical protein